MAAPPTKATSSWPIAVLPPVLTRKAGIFPIEACLLTVEIKSVLTAAGLRASDAAARKLAQFHHAPPIGASEASHETVEQVLPFVLALRTALVEGGKTEIVRYLRVIGTDSPAIQGLCVVGRGYWYRDDRELARRDA